MSKMNRGFIICLLVFGLSYAAEDNVGSETTDVGSKTHSGNINFRFFDKSKRGATKITNTDSPTFNHLTSSNVGSSASSSGGFKPSTATSNVPPFRYIYNQQQYYQPNPYLTYVQFPQAGQIAAQYSFQSNPVAHFLQTPNQIQYVAAPTVAQIPQIKYQTFSKEYSSANSASDSASAAAGGSQYVSQTQQSAVTSPDAYVSAASSGGSVSSNSQSKQVQVPLYPGYQAAQPLYYTQQPFLIFPQSQAANFIYQQPNVNYFLKQQQLAGVYGGNRLGLYTPTQNAQLTYLVPMVVQQPEQDSTSSTSSLKSSDKTVSSSQQSASSNSFAFGTKA